MGSRSRNTTPKPPPRVRNTSVPPAADRIAEIAARLAELWPNAVVELDHDSAYQLLVATILAAQSTDKLINTVTPALFAKYPDPTALAHADQAELEPMIFSTGFYRMKARHLIGMAQRIVEHHGGQVPETMAGLVDLPGVARKTANVVLGSALGKNEGVVVDTHVSRLAPRLGLTEHSDPVKIEQDLMQLVPRDQWSIFAHRLIWHGRRVCHAKQPNCDQCRLAPLCPSAALVATPDLMPPRNGRPAPPSRAAAERAAAERATAGVAGRTGGRASTTAGRASSQAGRASSQAGRASSQAGRASSQAGRTSSQAGRTSSQAGRASSQAGRASPRAQTVPANPAALAKRAGKAVAAKAGAKAKPTAGKLPPARKRRPTRETRA